MIAGDDHRRCHFGQAAQTAPGQFQFVNQGARLVKEVAAVQHQVWLEVMGQFADFVQGRGHVVAAGGAPRGYAHVPV